MGIFSIFVRREPALKPECIDSEFGAAQPCGPVAKSPSQAESTAGQSIPAPGSGKAAIEEAGHTRRILVVEDNPVNRKVMELMLRRLGYEADQAVDGIEAVEMASATRYDTILMDLHMPRMGGIEAADKIRSSTSSPPRMVAVTADTTDESRDACARVGIDAYLTKPVDPEQLRAELEGSVASTAAAGLRRAV